MVEKPSSLEIRKGHRAAHNQARERTLNRTIRETYGFMDGSLEQYESRLGWKHGYTLKLVRQHHAQRPNEPVTMLDFGCGKNRALRDLRAQANREKVPVELTGISIGDPRNMKEKFFDWYRDSIFVDRKRAGSALGVGRYDLIMSVYTFVHVYDPLQQLKQLYRALKIGGEMHIDFPKDALLEKFFDGQKDKQRFVRARARVQDLIEDLQRRGIDIATTAFTMTIRKNNVPLAFPNIRYQTPLDAEGKGLYRLVRNPEK